MSIGDVFFWIGFVFGIAAVLCAIGAAVLGWLIYDKIKEGRRNVV